MSLSIIFLAGGVGSRLKLSQEDLPKQYLDLSGKPLFKHSFDILKILGEMIVVADPAFHSFFDSEEVQFANPGKRRQDSVQNGFKKASGDWILVHDAARPFIDLHEVMTLIKAAERTGAATLACPLKFTVKEAGPDLAVTKTLDRDKLWEIQTPQVINASLMQRGFEIADVNNLTVTDDVSLAELAGVAPLLVSSSDKNLKITTPEDLLWARYKLQAAGIDA